MLDYKLLEVYSELVNEAMSLKFSDLFHCDKNKPLHLDSTLKEGRIQHVRLISKLTVEQWLPLSASLQPETSLVLNRR